MAKKKVQASCSECGTVDGLYIHLADGKKLPRYSVSVATGKISCYPCYDKSKVGA